ncbi:receptor-like protein 7 [Camellia sinensis]|uniref:receptor-like protein 7 n=1 Tax=Camellia sinensis TaxID=4442 RepID=UPI001036D0AB|nr:receptor-like protein 7 [Camellia sinensis]
MERLIWLFQFLLYFMQYHQVSCSSFISSFSTCTHHLCPHDQRFALLQFKHMFTINSSASWCEHLDLASPKMSSWNESCTDCCSWEGVTCDGLTGHVIGLDLSCSQLYGSIHPNSSLFQLSHLQNLNLAFNHFNYSHIPSAFGDFANLIHLNLSDSSFSGSIPSEIRHLSKLVSLDLSYGDQLRLEPHNFRMMLKNLTQLQELVLLDVNISSVVPMSLTNMSSLTYLDLQFTGLYGKLPNNIFHLPNLQILSLEGNFDLTGNLPKVNWSSSSSLRQLSLGFSSFSGELPDSIGYLKSLTSLDLGGCKFSGSIPDSLGNLTQITDMQLWGNNLDGKIPNFIGKLIKLEGLALGGNNFNGQIPFTLSNLNQLIFLGLSTNNLHGKIPNSIGNLINLEYLVLGGNNFNGPFPCGVANLTKLAYLDISSNELMGPIPSNISGLHNLQTLHLHNNRLTGPIPQSISNLLNLTNLDLSSNNLSGVVELQTFSNLKQLVFLDLSYNSLSVSTINNINNTLPNLRSFRMTSCKIKEFPDFFKALENVQELDISSNEIHGKIPKWVGIIGKASLTYLNLSHNFLIGINQFPWKNLDTLDLRSNLIQGQLPVPPLSVSYFLLSQNKLTGEIPSSICNARSLSILDLSHNNLSGAIPQCLGYFSNVLFVLDLRFNAFQGNIPMIFGKGNQLEILNLNGNQFEGPVPRSLTNCRKVQVLDLGNNKINDTFPYWLGTLPELRVLVLRSNKFHGPIDNSKPNLYFPKLRIVDLSHNKFTGHLPSRYFKIFKAMRNKTMPNEKYLSVGSYYQASIAVTMKGSYIDLTRIFTLFTAIDLSSNKFNGDIPNVIRRLTSLIVLNLSHNSLTGHIPSSLGDLTELESLDLSSNQLTGKIPNQLMSLTFLEVFNLSWNHLNGPIPRGEQLDTFGNDSYVGNSGLCGFPLSKECKDNQAQVQPGVLLQQEDDSNFVSGFTWEAVLMGYGCGLALGLAIGFLMFLTGKPKLFVRIVEGKKHKKVKMLRQGGRRN